MRLFLISALTALLAGGLFLPGCSVSTVDPNAAAKPDSATDSLGDGDAPDRPKIALVMKSLANEFFSTMAEGARQHQAANADRYELVVNGIKDESDLARQVSLVEEMIGAGVDAVVIAPADSKALVPALRRAVEAGVIVVNIDNQLDADVMQSEGLDVPFVGPDNRAGAKVVGDYLASQLSAGDPVAIIEGVPTAFNGQQRRLGFEDAMEEAGMEIVSSQAADWETDKANTIASSILSEHPETKAILAANDSMALGAVVAVKTAGKTGEVQIVGFDNIEAVRALIGEGKILATADQHGDELAVYGIETALELIDNRSASAEDVKTPVDLVTAETLSNP